MERGKKVVEDRLSELPDELIHHIFSYLDSRDAFRCGGDVPGFFAGDGFCCIKQAVIDINIEVLKYESGKELTRQNITNMFEAVRRTPLLILSWNIIQILCGIPSFTEYQPSPFGNIKFLHLRGQPISEEATRSTANHVIHYLLSESPCAEILKFK